MERDGEIEDMRQRYQQLERDFKEWKKDHHDADSMSVQLETTKQELIKNQNELKEVCVFSIFEIFQLRTNQYTLFYLTVAMTLLV